MLNKKNMKKLFQTLESGGVIKFFSCDWFLDKITMDYSLMITTVVKVFETENPQPP